jgi:hypothetical protein
MDEVENLVQESDLPESVDSEYWESFICEVLEKELFKVP